jgi:hypothetical protein
MILKEQNIMIHGSNYKFTVEKFNSIHELVTFLRNTKNKIGFGDNSKTGGYSFTGTQSYEEAEDLLMNGWEQEAVKLTETLKSIQINKSERNKMIYDIVGFQPSVPRYIQGIPQNMFNSKKIATKKSKIIDVYKEVSYSGNTTKETIQEESIKALRIIQLLENQGYKCNLYVCDSISSFLAGKAVSIHLKIKNSSDRLNIGKIAFPLVHSSFLRRIVFSWIEKSSIVSKEFAVGYGSPIQGSNYKNMVKDLKKLDIYKNALFIPNLLSISEEEFIKKELENIK